MQPFIHSCMIFGLFYFHSNKRQVYYNKVNYGIPFYGKILNIKLLKIVGVNRMNLHMNNNKKPAPKIISVLSWVSIGMFGIVWALLKNDNPMVNLNHFRISFFLMILFGLIEKSITKEPKSRNVYLMMLGAFIIIDFWMGAWE
jgi:hypothetical protein